MKKKLFCLSLVFVFSLIFCACDGSGKDLQQQINDLKAKIVEQNDNISKLIEDNNDINKEIESMETENRLLKGQFFDLIEAYDKNIINKEDVKSISYYLTGMVMEITDYAVDDYCGEIWKSEIGMPENYWTVIRQLDFTPETEKPVLDPEIENIIKTAYFIQSPESFQRTDGSFMGGPEDIDIKFLGKYKNSYAMRISLRFLGYGPAAYPFCVADIAFQNECGGDFFILNY